MAWNEPGNKGGGGDRDPWGNNNKNGNQGPPDLDEVITKLTRKFGGIFGGGKKPSVGGGGGVSGFGIAVVLVILAVIWVASGFYTIKEAEKGVILTFGKYDAESGLVDSGLNWKATFIQEVIPVNVEAIRSLPASGFMLTEDENVVRVEMDVQYKVIQPHNYLFSVTAPDDSLAQATDSALRYVIGHTTMDDILTTGREVVRSETEELLNKIIEPYNLGIEVVDVNFLPARPPEEVKDAFDDAISAQEDEQRFIREAEAYQREIEPRARGRVQRIEQEAQGYQEQIVLRAQGEVARFELLLPEYESAPDVTRHRLYLETMEEIYGKSNKVLIDASNNSNMLYLPIDKLMDQGQQPTQRKSSSSSKSSTISSEPASSIPSRPSSSNIRSSERTTSGRN
ncbi:MULTISPECIES: FtsH protease activity modulator HflK [unclassified Agarivorans]|uniref:FtsH protease activity modulator HflK n=1 Tax=unclassified Agarivorans TaxID=2636026 RepID=UPI0026E116F1|nr:MULTISPECIES: FtsH protease activity modulator HflK [unclassified Agarivorans]MDO6688037.1 FtsH protease activity modulator HflK [Agarivorans sp. 3_MG-2023]MDO6717644.1 FtsH protease activity modulator HflK [Agarivorans sp. 2_MG-2023]